MILHGNQRGGYKDLAVHLMKPENERVVVHDLRGFVADDLTGAFQESYAISKGTRCTQHLFSLSLNPPEEADVSAQEFEAAIDQAEHRLGLNDQPRAIIFHDKRGVDGELRRHAHAVWCRIDTGTMKAVHLPHTHRKLREVSRELYRAHGWRMPDGLRDSKLRDVRNMSLEEWQQAKRNGQNPKEVKALFQDCWAVSDGRAAFAAALSDKGYVLAQGKRGHVAVDHNGEVYPVSRWVGMKAKDVRARLGNHDDLLSVDAAQQRAAAMIAERLKELKDREAQAVRTTEDEATKTRQRLLAEQAREAARLREDQAKRKAFEEAQRQARLRKGLLGFVDRLTGRRKRTLEDNRKEQALHALRDTREAESTRQHHAETLRLYRDKLAAKAAPHREAVKELGRDMERLRAPPDRQERSPSKPRKPRRARPRDAPEP